MLSGLIQNIQPDEDAARANGEAALWVVWYALRNSTLSVFVRELLLSVVSACVAAFVAYPILTFSTLVVAGRVSTKDLIPILWQRILGIPRGGEAGQPRLTDILYKGFVWRVVEVLVFYGLQSAGRWLTVMMFGRGCSLLQGMTLDPKDAPPTQHHTRHHSQQHHDEEGSSSSSEEEEDEEKERYASVSIYLSPPPFALSLILLPLPDSARQKKIYSRRKERSKARRQPDVFRYLWVRSFSSCFLSDWRDISLPIPLKYSAFENALAIHP